MVDPVLRCKPKDIRRWLALLGFTVLIFGMLSSLLCSNKTWNRDNVSQEDAGKSLREMPVLSQVESKACWNITVTLQECDSYKLHEYEVTQQFPLHFISGAPGSGNDWIRWMATLNRYAPYTYIPGKRKYAYAVYGLGYKLQPDASKVNFTNFLFFKSHEPWWHEEGREISSHAKRAVLLIRHPFDACYSEYKRELLRRIIGKSNEDKKNAAVSVPLDIFVDEDTGKLNAEWKRYVVKYVNKWVRHAEYWLTDFDKPLHVLVYNNVIKDTVQEIENMQSFFGYNFNGPNLRRHCCVMADTMNPKLKRQKSAVDQHKEDIYKKDAEVVDQMNAAIILVHRMLDSKYPGDTYRIARG